MFCENCGNKLAEGDKFCTKCGHSTVLTETKSPATPHAPIVSDDKWWKRGLKVVYIFLLLQILWIVPAVWSTNAQSYECGFGSYSNCHYVDSYGTAFWYSLLALVIFMVVTRLIKITVLYIAMGRKPHWGKEFKKLY